MKTIMGIRAGTVLVLGATGQQGGSVARALRADGWAVRALVRDPSTLKAKALVTAGIETVRGDLGDTPSLRTALHGAYGVFSVQPSSGQGAAYGVSDQDEVRYGTGVATLATQAAVQHFVYSSANAAGPGTSGVGHFDSKSRIEDHISGLDMPSTIVRPSAFMEILLMPGLGLDEGRLTFFMRPHQPMQFIAVDDIGKIVAGIFAGRNAFQGRTVEIAGDSVTGNELADKLSRAAGRPIAYRRFPDDVLHGDPFLGKLADLVDDGRLAGHADLEALRRQFPGLLTMNGWLDGPGRAALAAALQATGKLALR